MNGQTPGQCPVKMLGAVVVAVSTLATATSQAGSLEVVDYFAGKDEECGPQVERAVRGRVTQVIAVKNVFDHGDSESFCTLVINLEETATLARYSASASICRPLLNGAVGAPRAFSAVDDHVCSMSE